MGQEVPLEIDVFHKGTEADIVFMGSHLLGDGLSYVNLMKDFMQIYCDGKQDLPVRHPRLISDAREFPKESELDEETKKQIEEINSYWQTARRVHSQQEYEQMYQKYHAYCGRGFIFRTIEEETFEEILAASKENGVKINTVLIMALLMAQNRTSQGVCIPVNNRALIQDVPLDSLGNYASAVNCQISYDREKSFWENAKAAGSIIESDLNNMKERLHVLQVFAALDPTVYEGIYFSTPDEAEWREKFSSLIQKERDPESLCISNIGNVKIQLENARYKITELVLVGQTTCAGNKSIGVATIGKQCSLSMWYLKNSLKREDMEQLFEDMVRILEEAVTPEKDLDRYYA